MNFSNVIGYDLDGVLVADFEYYEPVIDYLSKRAKMKSLFVPPHPYVIITGRPSDDLAFTVEWAERELHTNKPIKIFHGNHDINRAHLYKADVINEFGIEVFIESDKTQVEYLRAATKAKVIHFREILENVSIDV